MDEVRSWFEVPAIAHFFHVFRTSFDLPEFDIEDFEETLFLDSSENVSSFLPDLVIRLLRGLYKTKDGLQVTSENYSHYLKDLLQYHYVTLQQKENPVAEKEFKYLSKREKVVIIHDMCNWRLELEDAMELTKDLDADVMRVDSIGRDSDGNVYWYFYGTRLYREGFAVTPEKPQPIIKKTPVSQMKSRKRKTKSGRTIKKRRRLDAGSSQESSSDSEKDENAMTPTLPTLKLNISKSAWTLCCSTLEEWDQLIADFKGSKIKVEKELYSELVALYEDIPELFKEKEKALQRKLLAMAPRRASDRISLKMQQREEEERRLEQERLYKVEEKAKEARLKQEQLDKEKAKEREKRYLERERLLEERAMRVKQREEQKLIAENPELGKKTKFIDTSNGNKSSVLKKFEEELLEDEDIYKAMDRIMDVMVKDDDAWPFLEPVKEEEAPHYYEYIKYPMDFRTMREKIKRKEYENKEEFVDDMYLIFDNCETYNGTFSSFFKLATIMKKIFEKLVKQEFIDEVIVEDDDYFQVNSPSSQKKSSRRKSKPTAKLLESLSSTSLRKQATHFDGKVVKIKKSKATKISNINQLSAANTLVNFNSNNLSKLFNSGSLIKSKPTYTGVNSTVAAMPVITGVNSASVGIAGFVGVNSTSIITPGLTMNDINTKHVLTADQLRQLLQKQPELKNLYSKNIIRGQSNVIRIQLPVSNNAGVQSIKPLLQPSSISVLQKKNNIAANPLVISRSVPLVSPFNTVPRNVNIVATPAFNTVPRNVNIVATPSTAGKTLAFNGLINATTPQARIVNGNVIMSGGMTKNLSQPHVMDGNALLPRASSLTKIKRPKLIPSVIASTNSYSNLLLACSDIEKSLAIEVFRPPAPVAATSHCNRTLPALRPLPEISGKNVSSYMIQVPSSSTKYDLQTVPKKTYHRSDSNEKVAQWLQASVPFIAQHNVEISSLTPIIHRDKIDQRTMTSSHTVSLCTSTTVTTTSNISELQRAAIQAAAINQIQTKLKLHMKQNPSQSTATTIAHQLTSTTTTIAHQLTNNVVINSGVTKSDNSQFLQKVSNNSVNLPSLSINSGQAISSRQIVAPPNSRSNMTKNVPTIRVTKSTLMNQEILSSTPSTLKLAPKSIGGQFLLHKRLDENGKVVQYLLPAHSLLVNNLGVNMKLNNVDETAKKENAQLRNVTSVLTAAINRVPIVNVSSPSLHKALHIASFPSTSTDMKAVVRSPENSSTKTLRVAPQDTNRVDMTSLNFQMNVQSVSTQQPRTSTVNTLLIDQLGGQLVSNQPNTQFSRVNNTLSKVGNSTIPTINEAGFETTSQSQSPLNFPRLAVVSKQQTVSAQSNAQLSTFPFKPQILINQSNGNASLQSTVQFNTTSVVSQTKSQLTPSQLTQFASSQVEQKIANTTNVLTEFSSYGNSVTPRCLQNQMVNQSMNKTGLMSITNKEGQQVLNSIKLTSSQLQSLLKLQIEQGKNTSTRIDLPKIIAIQPSTTPPIRPSHSAVVQPSPSAVIQPSVSPVIQSFAQPGIKSSVLAASQPFVLSTIQPSGSPVIRVSVPPAINTSEISNLPKLALFDSPLKATSKQHEFISNTLPVVNGSLNIHSSHKETVNGNIMANSLSQSNPNDRPFSDHVRSSTTPAVSSNKVILNPSDLLRLQQQGRLMITPSGQIMLINTANLST